MIDRFVFSDKNIILIGFACTGKTVIGRALAKLLDFEFVETDEILQAAAGLSPAQVLKKYGGRRFFSEEELVYGKINRNNRQVIAVGCTKPCGELLNIFVENGVFVWLRSAEDVLYKRYCQKIARISPEKFRVILREQEAVYEQFAGLSLNSDEFPVHEAAKQLAKEIADVKITDVNRGKASSHKEC